MSQQIHNYYSVLGVTRTASLEQIRAAYRDKVRIIHPDSAVVASPTASMQMAEVVRAWSTLSNPDLKRAYDADLFDAELFDVESEVEDSFPPTPIVRGHFPKSLIGWILAIGIAGVE
jgi:curved DNA-binding protein CbpA